MAECNSIEYNSTEHGSTKYSPNMYPSLNDQQFRLVASASFRLAFSVSTGIAKKFLKTTRNKKKKHNKIVMLARSKLNSIESKISEALINNQISHEDFITIINKEKLSRIKRKY